MGIQINGITDTISATDGGLAVSGQQLTGVTDINASGIVTATQGYVVGTGASIFSPATNTLALGTNGSEKVRITSAGLLGVGISSPSNILDCAQSVNGNAVIQIANANTGTLAQSYFSASNGTNSTLFGTRGTTIISAGVFESGDGFIFNDINTANKGIAIAASGSNGTIKFATGGITEKARIDSSGRILVGTSSARAALFAVGSPLQVEGTSINSAGISVTRSSNDTDGPAIWIAKNRGGLGANATVVNGDELGSINFTGNNGNDQIQGASIKAFADGAVSGGGANDLPGRLVFSTTEDGTSSPTERVRITNNGNFYIGQSASATPGLGNTNLGVSFENTDGGSSRALWISRSAGAVAGFNRNTDDGTLVSLRQAGTEEGSISVSGTTVSYNGAHLSRWSQLPSGAERTEILRGSVLSNIDEMCEWPDEDNEQLNRMKVSDVEGDKNVSGVFQAWDDDDDTYTNDFYCAMTGDFIIRIGAGITVERGDLLMSAGDGTAKPQDDDIIRSKTIAKVTSTNVSCTYKDGSYCVPCVLMAC